MTGKLCVAVVQGGPSLEAEVSRASAACVAIALEEAGHRAVRFELDAFLAESLRTMTVVGGGRTYAGGLTKFEPREMERLLVPDLPVLIARLAKIPGIQDLALTTNGVLLPEQAEALYAAGLRRLNVHIDTLDRARFFEIGGSGDGVAVLQLAIGDRQPCNTRIGGLPDTSAYRTEVKGFRFRCHAGGRDRPAWHRNLKPFTSVR